jgi:hypothetical protein
LRYYDKMRYYLYYQASISSDNLGTPPQVNKNGGSGDIFRLSLEGSGNSSTDLIHLDGKDYVSFDLEWTNDYNRTDRRSNRTIYAAAIC